MGLELDLPSSVVVKMQQMMDDPGKGAQSIEYKAKPQLTKRLWSVKWNKMLSIYITCSLRAYFFMFGYSSKLAPNLIAASSMAPIVTSRTQ